MLTVNFFLFHGMHHVGWESRTDVVRLFYFKRAFLLHFSFSSLRAFSLVLFRRLLLHFSTSICTSFYSIFTSSCSRLRELRFECFYFDFKSIRGAFPLKLCAHSFSSIFDKFCFLFQIILTHHLMLKFVDYPGWCYRLLWDDQVDLG